MYSNPSDHGDSSDARADFSSGNLSNDFSIDPLNSATREEAIHQLNSFLRGEISATETYRLAIEKLSASENAANSNIGLLREIQEEHARAAQSIRQRIREMSGEPSDSSGAWGAWARFAMATAKLFGDAATLKNLKEGEEHGLTDYRDGMPDIDATSAELVRNQLIPAVQRHINLLAQLISAMDMA